MVSSINVLFLAAEAEPFVKIGGLADVAGSLPLAIRELVESAPSRKIDIRLVLPLHRAVRTEARTLRTVAEFSVFRSSETIPVQILATSLGGMQVYFIDGIPISSSPSVYSNDMAQDREKYGFFSIAALKMLPYLGWHPDIVHANDWHTAMALYALRSHRNGLELVPIRTVFTVHNLPYMGGEGSEVLSSYDLLPLNDNSLPGWAQTQPLPLGLWSADAIVPVSPTYAREILTPDFGCGLDPYLNTRADCITGILNGLDGNTWNPETDPFINARFTSNNLPVRGINKKALQKSLGLKEDGLVPLLVMVGRMDRQKGFDVAFESLYKLGECDWQFIVLGSGDPILESAARNLQKDFPDRVRAILRFDAELSHLLYGGGDIFLMPSRYEPCGLAQMIAMHYGCVPVVHATGGLIDTVKEGITGFLFQEANVRSLNNVLEHALTLYTQPDIWHPIQRNGMQQDFSWSRSANAYSAIYHSLVSDS